MSEINLLCVKPKNQVVYDKELFYLEKGKGYADNFAVMKAIKGSWYRLYSHKNFIQDDYVCGAYDIVEGKIAVDLADYYKYMIVDELDTMFRNDNPGFMPYYVHFLSDELSVAYINLLTDMLMASEIKTVIVLFRESLDSPEKIVGNISIDKFASLLRNNQIYENVVYIVKKYDSHDKYWIADV